jgi:xanthine dehydrogenase YagT iron-sulfur-binding subunit
VWWEEIILKPPENCPLKHEDRGTRETNQSPNESNPSHPPHDALRDARHDELHELTRREFVATAGLLTGAAFELSHFPSLSSHTAHAQSAPPSTTATPTQAAAIASVPVILNINGTSHNLTLDPRVTLLDLLRENLGLTGAKKGCDHGQCGACTVLANGRRINSCLSLAVTHDGDEIVTVEGLAKGDELNAVQAAFIETDGFQCGYCTSGQICSAVALLLEAREGQASFVTADLRRTGPANLTRDEIRERMSGNICRCGAYPGIVEAVEKAWRESSASQSSAYQSASGRSRA